MTILDALKLVASRDGDRARDRNDVGFSGQDTIFANKLAEQDSLSPKQEAYAAKFVRKYRKQVYAMANPTCALKGKARETAVVAFLASLTWQHASFTEGAVEPAKAKPSRGKVTGLVGQNTNAVKGFVVRMPRYDAELVAAIKALPNRQYKDDNGDKKWTVGTTDADKVALAKVVADFNLEASAECRALLGVS